MLAFWGCACILLGSATRYIWLSHWLHASSLTHILAQFLVRHVPGESSDDLQLLPSTGAPPAQQPSEAAVICGPQALFRTGPNLAEQALEAAIASGNPQQLTSAIHAAVRALGSGIAGSASQAQVTTLHSLSIKHPAFHHALAVAPTPIRQNHGTGGGMQQLDISQ